MGGIKIPPKRKSPNANQNLAKREEAIAIWNWMEPKKIAGGAHQIQNNFFLEEKYNLELRLNEILQKWNYINS